ncbi:transcriptional regulator [Gloeomargarita lithophora Alchichica-D10]|uniref:Transcriptional regulator n=1 Tax=Gloeomargarita lithophora Alchichica-D10 TaxID=1188229 RepID=A0A1J0ABJ6_9CYAN|nr:metalloregulator ArsR/SmtB family transcription factor [Gloeomargarita lithophora]APB33293.1 transcriptional regulator [Gloeomargarita lithophora Alchichica-D10]
MPKTVSDPHPWQCCPPLLTGKLTPTEAIALAGIFRVLGDPTRLHLLSLIAAQPHQEVPACALVETLGLSQPTISHHLKVMYEAGLLTKQRRGTGIYYQLVPECLATLQQVLAGTELSPTSIGHP